MTGRLTAAAAQDDNEAIPPLIAELVPSYTPSNGAESLAQRVEVAS